MPPEPFSTGCLISLLAMSAVGVLALGALAVGVTLLAFGVL